MWQKLKQIDIYKLEKARIQLINAIRLVCAAPRSYLKDSDDNRRDWLIWDVETSSIVSREFGMQEKISVTLDIEQFVLSIYGPNGHIEHLVLSGLTYPMAFGWMKIKLDTFHLNGEEFNDESVYSIAHTLGVDDEMNITDQNVFSDLVIYFSNAYHSFIQLKNELNIHGKLLINPENLNLVLTPEGDENVFSFGFSPGDNVYLEPYFYIQLEKVDEKILHQLAKTIGIWNNKNWNGLVFLASEFLTLDPDHEKIRVMDFFKKNYWRLK